MIENQNLGKSLNVRKSKIIEWKKDLDNKVGQYEVEISKDVWETLDVYNVPIDFPIYRLENIRSKSAQSSYIARKKIKNTFFDDPEDRDALEIQHHLLFEIAQSGDEKNHYKVFQNEKFKRSEPFIINSQGVLINGNTRMSALRQLYFEDTLKYAHFEKIPMAILPNMITPKNERFIENSLQIETDIKKAYSWTAEAINVRERRVNESIEIISNDYKRKKTNISHPRNLLNQLNMADKYLKKINRERDYELLLNNQYALWAIYNFYEKFKNDPVKAKNWLKLAFGYLSQSRKGETKGDDYKNLNKAGKAFHKKSIGFTTLVSDTNTKNSDTGSNSDGDDMFGSLGAVGTIESPDQTLIADNVSDEDLANAVIVGTQNFNEETQRQQNRNQIYDDISNFIEKTEDNIKKIQDKSSDFDRLSDSIEKIDILKEKLNILKEFLKKRIIS